MLFLVRSQASAAALQAEDDPALDERHWTYMDAHALVARGPTLGPDRASWTGSIHLVELPGPDAVPQFIADEPYHRAGAYERHLVWRFTDLLGRTMNEFARAPDQQRFFVFAAAEPAPFADLLPQLRERVIVYGALHDLADDTAAGLALALQAPTRAALDDLLAGDPSEPEGSDVEVLDWEFGGRR